jgi:hypothetical protein
MIDSSFAHQNAKDTESHSGQVLHCNKTGLVMTLLSTFDGPFQERELCDQYPGVICHPMALGGAVAKRFY